jgi:hypothetical protein
MISPVRISFSRRAYLAFFVTGAAITASGCSLGDVFYDPAAGEVKMSHIKWVESGSLAVVRSAPAELSVHDALALSIERGAQVLGFGPLPTRPIIQKASLQPQYALLIKRSEGVLAVVQSGRVVTLIECEGTTSVAPGNYTVEHKQMDPVWYATDEYFTRRGLSVPVEGAKDRFLRGAYGKHALFLSSSLALHSSHVWTPEVGGIRLPSQELTKLFENLPLTTAVKVVE